MTISDRYTLLTQPPKSYLKYTRELETCHKLLILFCLFVFAWAKFKNQNSLWRNSSFGRWPLHGRLPSPGGKDVCRRVLCPHLITRDRPTIPAPGLWLQWGPAGLRARAWAPVGTSGLSASLWVVGGLSEPFLHKMISILSGFCED